MASSTSTAEFIYKRVYSGARPGEAAMRDRPLFTKLGKKGGFIGTDFRYTVRYAQPQGIATTLADAQTALNTTQGVQFAAVRRTLYGDIDIDCVSALAAKEKGEGAFYDLITMETDGILNEMGDRMAFNLFTGAGAIGRRSSIAGEVVTLSVPDDVRNFKVGMLLQADDTATGASPRVGSTTVASVQHAAGTVTLTSQAGITGFVNDDYLFAYGTVDSGIPEGLASHFPLTAPASAESFRGVDRSADDFRLAGVRLDDTSASPEDNARLVAVKIKNLGKKATHLYLNPMRFYEVSRRMDAKIVYDGGGDKGAIGFETFSLHTAAGALIAVSDANCPVNRGYVLNPSNIYIKYLGSGVPHIAMDDGIKTLRKSTTDVMETRARAIWNTVAEVPSENGVFSCAT